MNDLNIESIDKIAVIMAGGGADNLWPKSTANMPKGFNHFFGVGTMLQNTFSRLKPLFKLEDIYIVTDSKLVTLVKEEFSELPEENIIIEPFGKNTAPCLGLTGTILMDRLKDDTMMVAFPYDHVINNDSEFHQSLITSIHFAYNKRKIVTIGIAPTQPNTNYGYIQVKEIKSELDDYYDLGVRHSSAFAEKPDLATALRFIESGDFVWNSGIFIWRVDTFWDAFKEYLPDHYTLFESLKNLIDKEFLDSEIETAYRKMSSESVDYAILEKSKNVFVVKSTFAWSDLSNWEEVFSRKIKDARNNFIEGHVIPIDVEDCYISSKEKLIGILGVKNLIVVEDENSILICDKSKSDKVNDIVSYMKRKHILPYL